MSIVVSIAGAAHDEISRGHNELVLHKSAVPGRAVDIKEGVSRHREGSTLDRDIGMCGISILALGPVAVA
jgi:hypothetical protein